MIKKTGIISLILTAGLLVTSCGANTADTSSNSSKNEVSNKNIEASTNAGTIDGLEFDHSMDLNYATGFNVDYYKDGYKSVHIASSDENYLVVPEGMEAPDGLSEDYQVLYQPLDSIYLAATASMALFDSLDALDNIKLVGTQESGWYIDNAKKAMQDGRITFAGKYSEPDYEMLIDNDCDVAIESTMILHSPKVKEMIETLEIPVFTDYASYESHPLGRTEWIKLYGALLNKEDVADSFFDEQKKVLDELENFENTGKTVAFFYVHTDGSIVVRSSSDYIPNMIEIAGGKYIYDNIANENSNSSSVSISMEEFYTTAMDADYLIYNASISSPIASIDELIQKSELFKDFKAVKEGNVWTTGKSMYQATDLTAQIISDLHKIISDDNKGTMQFFSKVN